MSTAPSAPSLAIVLPAYNEADRIGPGLDELFGYLDRHGERARSGAPGSAALPDHIEVLVIDDGSTDGTAAIVAARPEAAPPAGGRARLRVVTVPHGGKGAAVRAGMLLADTDLVIFADADMATPPDQLPLLVAALADHDLALGSRIQPDGSDMRASQPSYRRLLGKAFHQLASIWAVGPVQDTQCGFKGFTRQAAQDLFEMQRVTSIVFDVEVDLPGSPAGLSDRGGPDPLGGSPRVSHAPGRGPGRARGMGPVPDPADPSAHPPARGATDLMDIGRLGRLGRAALPIVAIAVFAMTTVAILATAGDTLGYDYRGVRGRGAAGARRAAALRPGRRRRRRVRDLPVPADVRPRLRPVRAPAGRRGSVAVGGSRRRVLPRRAWRSSRSGRASGGLILLLGALDWPLLYALKLGQVGPLLFLLFAVGWRWLDRAVPLGSEHGGRGDDQGPAADPAGVGGPDGSLAGGGHRGRASWP